MTRTPLEEVNFMHKNGRWGTMIVVKGGKVLSAKYTDIFNLPDLFSAGPIPGAFGAIANLTSAVMTAGLGKTTFRIGYKGISVDTFGGDVEVIARFDTLERFRTGNGGYFCQLKPRPTKPYEIRMDISRNVKGYVDKDKKEHKGVNNTGQCFRVHGHDTVCSGVNAGILLHEAPHPGWLLGCIAPREINNRIGSNDKAPSRNAMEGIFNMMGGFSEGKKAELLVMDW